MAQPRPPLTGRRCWSLLKYRGKGSSEFTSKILRKFHFCFPMLGHWLPHSGHSHMNSGIAISSGHSMSKIGRLGYLVEFVHVGRSKLLVQTSELIS